MKSSPRSGKSGRSGEHRGRRSEPRPSIAQNYSAGEGWEESFSAAVDAVVPAALAGNRLDQALVQLFPQYSRNRLQTWLREGHIRVDGSSRPAKQSVLGGEKVSLQPPEAPASGGPAAQAMPLDIVYEDADLIVIDKPVGLVVHPGAGVPDRTLMNALLAHAPELAKVPRAGIVHRIDKDTSGLLVVARTVESQVQLARQLADRSMSRTYTAVVQGDPPGSGVVDAPIGRDTRLRTRMAVSTRGKPARTHYRVIERFGDAAVIECRLETGRTHQIRVHMQHIRHPLIGDTVYRRGTRRGIDFPRQALHACELSLIHPRAAKPVSWSSPLPLDMKQLIARLRARDY